MFSGVVLLSRQRLPDGATYEEIASDYGVSYQAIRQHAERVFRRLRIVRGYLRHRVWSVHQWRAAHGLDCTDELAMWVVAAEERLPLQVVRDYVTLPLPSEPTHDGEWPWNYFGGEL